MKIPFDIKFRPQIESGEYKAETKDGFPARIICWDSPIDKERPIIAIVFDDQIEQYKADGRYDNDFGPSNYDLFIVTPEEELTEFEQEVSDIVEYCKEHGGHVAFDYAKRHAKTLLAFAREQFIKDGYVIEKKAFHDAVENVDPEVMKEVSDNVDKENELAKKHIEGYIKGREDTLREMKDYIESHFNSKNVKEGENSSDLFYIKFEKNQQPVPCPSYGGMCFNPMRGCINCPRMTTMEMYNTTSGTSTGNTSATDGKEHNPSFTD